MNSSFIASIVLVSQLLLLVECSKTYKINVSENVKRHGKIKIVHYALKNADKFQIVSVPAKNLQIEPYENWLAKAIWTGNNYNQTGWSILEIESNRDAADADQAFAVGALEGYLTRDLISLQLINTVGDFCQDSSETCNKLIDFLTANYNWTSQQIAKFPNDPYWHHVNLVYSQFNGLFHGYYNITSLKTDTNTFLEAMAKDIKPYLNLIALQLNGDMGELLASISKISNPFLGGSCSALIKLLPNNNDLFVSHVTWTVFESLLRVMKHFKLNYHYTKQGSAIIPGNEVSFSSYPGILASIDDFYVINSNLVVLETTIGNSNVDLWKFVTPETNLYWVRNLIANRLSTSGAEWSKYFSLFNSGTYNNEWMIIDYKRFFPNEELRDGLLTVLEQLPGQVVWTDRTDVLRRQSYWPSYNLAYYPEVYNISGTYDAFLKYGPFFSYDDSPRANIFRRDHHKVTDVNSMISLMRYNNYTKDPLSQCDCTPPYSGENTISARSDLNPASGVYPFDALGHRDHGATDMKLTNMNMMKKLEFIGICGPTHDNGDITPFSWSKADFGNSTNHFGLTDTYTFDPLHVSWDF